MKKKNSVEDLLDMYSNAGLQREWGVGFSAMWQKFGSKKYTGRKGMENITHDLQDMYVIMERAHEKIQSLKKSEKELEDRKPAMWDIKVDTVRKQIDAESISYHQLELRYKFLTLIRSMYTVISGQQILSNVDRFFSNRKNMDSIKSSMRGILMNEIDLEKNMDSMSVYMDTLRGKTEKPQDYVKSPQRIRDEEKPDDNVEVV